MKRQVTMEEISDGRLYDANDMVKAAWILSGFVGEQERLLRLCLQERLN